MKKIVIFGGSFNPFHIGHDAIVKYAASLNRYDEVWIMPSACRSDKPGLLANAIRIEMLHSYKRSISFNGAEKVKISDFEICLGAPSETIRTYAALKEQYPMDQFTFIFGADAFIDMPRWRGGKKLCRELNLLIVARPETKELAMITDKDITFLPSSTNVSSTRIRELLRNSQSINHLVPKEIASYINLKHLYA